jgi:hypothetical protein
MGKAHVIWLLGGSIGRPRIVLKQQIVGIGRF